jgi:hypothetical protein
MRINIILGDGSGSALDWKARSEFTKKSNSEILETQGQQRAADAHNGGVEAKNGAVKGSNL